MRRAVRHRPYAPAGYYILGNVLWEQRRFQEATDLYRFAASLEDRDEQFAEAYFRAARAAEQAPEAMRFLKARYERTRGKVSGPARAMFYCAERTQRNGDRVCGTRGVLDWVRVGQGGAAEPAGGRGGDALRGRNADELQ